MTIHLWTLPLSRCIVYEFYTYLDMSLWVVISLCVIVLKCVFAWEHIIIFPFLVALNQNINWAPGDFLSTKRLMNRTTPAVHTTNETTVNLNKLNEHLLLDTSSKKSSKVLFISVHILTSHCTWSFIETKPKNKRFNQFRYYWFYVRCIE